MTEISGQMGAPAPAAEVPSMMLGEYLAQAGKALRTNLPRAWVEAIVLDAKPTKQGMSIELVELSLDESNDGRSASQRDGRLRGMIWARTAKAIEEAVGLPLDAPTLKGAHVRLMIKTKFHPRWHLEGEVLDLDPAMIQGLVERRLEAIRASLRSEGLYRAQQVLPEPMEITSLAVIHPDRSAGWADVAAELDRLQARGIIRMASHPVAFEGAGSAGRIADVLQTIGAGELPDVILIVRGGGAAAGLATLANLGLARAICRCPVPIITGIGHANDRTILDELAWRAADTPSKAIGLVKSILHRRSAAARDDHRAILECVDRLVCATLRPLLSSSCEALAEMAEKFTAVQALRLRNMAHGIERHVIAFRGSIDLTQADLNRIAGALLVAAPAVPRMTDVGLRSLYATIVQTARGRMPRPDALPAEARWSASIVAGFVERQTAELRTALSTLETVMRRRLGEETARLAALGKAAQTLDLDATLARGFVLPLDNERRIIRSAHAAQAAERFELLFVDGRVACRPTIV